MNEPSGARAVGSQTPADAEAVEAGVPAGRTDASPASTRTPAHAHTPTAPTSASTSSTRRPPRGLGPAFGRFWAAYTAGNLADGMALTAFPLVAAFLTTDPLLVGGLMAMRFLPWLLFGAFAGAVVDRVDRIAAMRAAGAVRAAAMGVLAVLLGTGHATIWTLYAAMFAVMACETVYDSAAPAQLPALVGRDRLDAANSRLEGGRVVTEDCAGAPAAGLLFGVAALLPVATGGLAFLLSAVLLVAIPATARRAPPQREPGPEPPDGDGDAPEPGSDGPELDRPGPDGPGPERRADGAPHRGVLRSVFADTAEGLRYIARDRVQAGLAGFTLGANVGVQTATAVLVLFVQHKLGVPAHLFGFFLATGAIGAVAGAAAAAPLARRVPKAALLVGGFVLMGLLVGGVGATSSAPAAAVLWGAMGFCNAVGTVIGISVLQTITPDHLLGRVMGARKALGWGLAPIGSLLGGLLGRIDLAVPVILGGLIVACMPLLFFRAMVGSVRRAEAERASTS